MNDRYLLPLVQNFDSDIKIPRSGRQTDTLFSQILPTFNTFDKNAIQSGIYAGVIIKAIKDNRIDEITDYIKTEYIPYLTKWETHNPMDPVLSKDVIYRDAYNTALNTQISRLQRRAYRAINALEKLQEYYNAENLPDLQIKNIIDGIMFSFNLWQPLHAGTIPAHSAWTQGTQRTVGGENYTTFETWELPEVTPTKCKNGQTGCSVSGGKPKYRNRTRNRNIKRTRNKRKTRK
jgi:hypothetical protein